MRTDEQRMSVGKPPYRILRDLIIDKFKPQAADVLVGPGIGEDAALLKVGREVVAVHSDPVTGSIKDVGWIAVNVAANDISSRGIEPRWLSVVILMPEGSGLPALKMILNQVKRASEAIGAEVVGGHTEITFGLKRPILVVTAMGKARLGRMVTTGGGQPGDAIIASKALALEGTAIIATELPGLLMRKGVSRATIARAVRLRGMLSVVNDSRIAMRSGCVTAMHDVTEGGVVTALLELALASGLGVEAYEARMAILPETETICSAMGIDPLRTMGSGSLLIVARKVRVHRIIRSLQDAGIHASQIGVLTSSHHDVRLHRIDGRLERLSKPVDENLWRVMARTLRTDQ